ncbi:LysR substrate-binding domain-containing protein [Sphingobacterium bovistauri]|uniref:LysR family transcriptional regulator n=1 Tax=Sphingobacterium bovistauri TaxID=2781959 RepID=A0ABS7Z8E4_9SPHI|nr:LysR substrate-binding domain-containing protein [Sphingobacterium bovistauri]MCA5006463.1 LysR family transcriptional regulator [Sphingobacterium bovistauri]
MNIQQLQYIVAIDEHRHFQRAAESCFVTPATLSMMVKKLEEELEVTIFDRSKQPISPTDIGNSIIEKAKTVLYHIKDLENTAKGNSNDMEGDIRIAVIPTLAPYLSHLFLPQLIQKYPNMRIKLYEWNTNQIVEALNHDRLDIGIAATPLGRAEIKELPVFYEKLVAYTTDENYDDNKEFIAPQDINLKKLWLLEEDHCLRAQVANLCSLKKKYGKNLQLDFEAGSIETLLNMVNINNGITILPELAVHTLSPQRKLCVKKFTAPIPVREISLLTYRHFIKTKLLQVLADEIKEAVTPYLSEMEGDKRIIDIQ